MKYCEKCHVDYADDQNFCNSCGEKLVDKPTIKDVEAEYVKEVPEQLKKTDKQKKGGRIIKRIIIGVVAVLVILFLWGTHLMNSTSYIILNSEGELFAKCGGETEVGIDYDGYVWEIAYKPSWVVVDEYDNSFRIACLPNYTGEDREDHITIKSGKMVEMLPVGQYGGAKYIRLSEKSVKEGTSGGSIHIDIETDGTDPEISYPDFCTVTAVTPEGFNLTVKRNNGYSRNGTLYVKEDNATASIYIRQKGKCSDCGGEGKKMCPSCGGSGQIGWGYYTSPCYTCGTTGRIDCYSCSGTGER